MKLFYALIFKLLNVKIMKNYILLFILGTDDEIVNYEVTISILEPVNGAVYSSGEELHMEVDFDGTKEIRNYEVLALNLTSGDTIAHFTGTSGDLFVPFHDHVEDVIVTETSNCTLTASAWEIEYADRISESVTFTINP